MPHLVEVPHPISLNQKKKQKKQKKRNSGGGGVGGRGKVGKSSFVCGLFFFFVIFFLSFFFLVRLCSVFLCVCVCVCFLLRRTRSAGCAASGRLLTSITGFLFFSFFFLFFWNRISEPCWMWSMKPRENQYLVVDQRMAIPDRSNLMTGESINESGRSQNCFNDRSYYAETEWHQPRNRFNWGGSSRKPDS